jgi:DNA-binding NarL/FixJ family response regulator
MRSVLVVHPHRAHAEAIGLAIDRQPDLSFAGIARHVDGALRSTAGIEGDESRPPDVAVIDAAGDRDVEEAIHTVRSAFPEVRLVVVTDQVDPVMLRRAAVAGVQGFVSDNDSLAHLLDAIRSAGTDLLVVPVGTFVELVTAMDGEDPATAGDDAAEPPSDAGHADGARREDERITDADAERDLERAFERSGLTQRERDVLEHLAMGHDPQAIARELFMSVHTARGHLKNIMMKLQAHTQLEAVVAAARAGLLPSFPAMAVRDHDGSHTSRSA